MDDEGIQFAERILADFAARTGVRERDGARRYLWTDAFAVITYVGLFERTGREEFVETARQLVDRVHHALGRHRADDERVGWISGLSDAEGELHPTAGGLRIGKPIPERRENEPFDDRLEWERDGQYFHYLTKWMTALERLAAVTHETRLLDWASELAESAHRAFVHRARNGEVRMFWKMSVDLSRPAVRSMGQLDPLDGLVTLASLDLARGRPPRDACRDFRAMCHGLSAATDDPLSLGGLLADVGRLVGLLARGALERDELLARLLADARIGLTAFARGFDAGAAPERRLAFRELGLSIGLASLEPMRDAIGARPDRFGGQLVADHLLDAVRALARFAPLADAITRSWSTPRARAGASWTDHRDINSVMLATSLVPEACRGLASLPPLPTTIPPEERR